MGGCGAMCPLRAAVVGTLLKLRPGQVVLDVGSGCGQTAVWLHDWFGARTIGVDFVEKGVLFAREKVASRVPARFCWLDIAATGLSFLPIGLVDVAVAFSVL